MDGYDALRGGPQRSGTAPTPTPATGSGFSILRVVRDNPTAIEPVGTHLPPSRGRAAPDPVHPGGDGHAGLGPGRRDARGRGVRRATPSSPGTPSASTTRWPPSPVCCRWRPSSSWCSPRARRMHHLVPATPTATPTTGSASIRPHEVGHGRTPRSRSWWPRCADRVGALSRSSTSTCAASSTRWPARSPRSSAGARGSPRQGPPRARAAGPVRARHRRAVPLLGAARRRRGLPRPPATPGCPTRVDPDAAGRPLRPEPGARTVHASTATTCRRCATRRLRRSLTVVLAAWDDRPADP